MNAPEQNEKQNKDFHIFNHEEVLPLIQEYQHSLKVQLRIVRTILEEPGSFPAEIISLLQYSAFSCMREYLNIANKIAVISNKLHLRGDAIGMTVKECVDMFDGLVRVEEGVDDESDDSDNSELNNANDAE